MLKTPTPEEIFELRKQFEVVVTALLPVADYFVDALMARRAGDNHLETIAANKCVDALTALSLVANKEGLLQ